MCVGGCVCARALDRPASESSGLNLYKTADTGVVFLSGDAVGTCMDGGGGVCMGLDGRMGACRCVSYMQTHIRGACVSLSERAGKRSLVQKDNTDRAGIAARFSLEHVYMYAYACAVQCRPRKAAAALRCCGVYATPTTTCMPC